MEIVLDASIAVKWFNVRSEDNVEIALEIQRQTILNKLEIIVPDLFFLEIINAFLTRSKFSIEDIFIIEEALHKMDLKVIYPDHSMLNSAIKIAHACDLTIYDSLYIGVAKFYKASLLTEDKKILKNKNKFKFINSPEEFRMVL
jgi:predicted nucleic acid-binding protein